MKGLRLRECQTSNFISLVVFYKQRLFSSYRGQTKPQPESTIDVAFAHLCKPSSWYTCDRSKWEGELRNSILGMYCTRKKRVSGKTLML